MEKTTKEINKQLNKEALWAGGSVLVYLLWILGFAFGLYGSSTMIMGFPAWFFMSCIAGWILYCIATVIIVKKVYVEIEFEPESVNEETVNKGRG